MATGSTRQAVPAGAVVGNGRVRAAGVVALIGAGPAPRKVLDACLSRASAVVAADGGARRLVDLGRIPDAVIGDMDSAGAALASIPEPRRIALDGQDDTDFEKALSRIDAQLVLGCGFLGGRTDHALTALSVLARYGPWTGRRAPPCILVDDEDAICALPPRIALELPPGTRTSLFPMTPVTGRSTGLRWPIDGLDLSPMGRTATSNAATGPIRLEMDAPGMLLLLPPGHLDALVAALLAPEISGESARGERSRGADRGPRDGG